MQDISRKKVIYLISGPLGVGKSTASRELAGKLDQSVLIEGDHLLHVFKGEPQPAWEERLRLAWLNILAVTRNFIQHHFNVIIDFVVEDELEWFCKQMSDLNVTVNYVILRADKDKLVERLTKRGDIQYLERSLFLLNQIDSSPSNRPYIYETSLKQPSEIVEEIINDPRFRVC